jgi:hypothetical protein
MAFQAPHISFGLAESVGNDLVKLFRWVANNALFGFQTDADVAASITRSSTSMSMPPR